MFAFRFGTPIDVGTIAKSAWVPPWCSQIQATPERSFGGLDSLLERTQSGPRCGHGARNPGLLTCTFRKDYNEGWFNEFADAKREFGQRDPRRVSCPATGFPEETETTVSWRDQLKPVVKNRKSEVYCS